MSNDFNLIETAHKSIGPIRALTVDKYKSVAYDRDISHFLFNYKCFITGLFAKLYIRKQRKFRKKWR